MHAPGLHAGFLISENHSRNLYKLDFVPPGVPILHLIVTPFPTVWHTMDDNMDNIDGNVSKDVTAVVKAFVVEYMQLDL